MPPSLYTDNTTFVNPFGLIFTLLVGVLVIAVPKRHAALPVLAMMCYMTMGMRVMVGGLNFTMIRILLLFCWSRLLVRGELRKGPVAPMDRAIVYFALGSIFTHGLLLGYDGVKYKAGQAYDALGLYFFFRCIFTDWRDVIAMPKMFALLLLPVALEMVRETTSLTNMFAAFGGVTPDVIIRDGTPRAQGPFSHPILAGTFGATLMPLMVAMTLTSGSRLAGLVGWASATAITLAAGSSGPVVAYAAGTVGLAMWPLRHHMRLIRWAMLCTVIGLHMVMKAPVWFLIGRFSVHDASTGYHRAILIDRCIANFWDWWLYGTVNYFNWGYYLFDRTNHYVCVATDGGLLSLLLFILILKRGFGGVGVIVRRIEATPQAGGQLLAWGMGASLLVHCVSFISITYFDQNVVNWHLLLGLIGSGVAIWQVEQGRAEVASPSRVRRTGALTGKLAFR